MLYNVIIGNTNKLKANWRFLDSGTYQFYEKSDIYQRIRLEPGVTHQIKPVYHTDAVQCYDIGNDKRWKNNTSSFNASLIAKRTDKPFFDTSEQHIIYITVMNNYQISDFETPYEIRGTFHKKGEYQGCMVIMTEQEVQEYGHTPVLTVYAYNKKKNQPCTITVKFKKNEDGRIDTTHLETSVKSIKDADEKSRVNNLGNEQDSLYPGFKCLIHPNKFVTSVYFVSPEYRESIDKMVRFKNKQIIVVDDALLNDRERLNVTIQKVCKGKIRAVTEAGIRLPLDLIKENHLRYVFTYSESVDHGLACIRSI